MSTRRAKQLIYGALYLIVLLLLIGIFYLIFIRPFISGPTTPVCTPSTCAPTSNADFATSTVDIFVTSSGHYTFLTNVLDNNMNYGSQAFNYQIDLYDASGTLIESVPGQSFIYPSQSKYLVALNVSVPQAVDHAAMEILGIAWTPSSTLGAIPQFVLQNTQATVGSTTDAVSGQLTNSNLGSYEKVVIMAIFNNGNANIPTGVSQTEIDNLQAQFTTNFSVIYPALPNINPASNQIIVYALR